MDGSIVAIQPSAIQSAALILAVVATVAAIRLRFLRDHTEKKGHPLPPGPTPFPLLGSVLSIDRQEPWLTYTAWGAKYASDMIYVRLVDTDIIVLNSYSDAKELLEKRSHIYSDRPFLATLKPYGQGINFAFAPYGPRWRSCRRILHQTFRAEAAVVFRPMQLRRARQIVVNVIDNPNEYPSHFATFAAGIAMSAVYDYEPQPREDPIVEVVHNFCKVSFPALIPEKAVFLKAFPFLLNVPEWVPGLSWISRESNKACALSTKTVETPYQWVQRRMEAKKEVAADSMVFDHTQRMEKFEGSHRTEYETNLKQACSTAFFASVESSSTTLMIFTLAMVKNPHVWKRAQTEIDTVIGTDRLPEFEDRDSLPYVEAIIREVARWKPVTPVGVPHAATSDDIYKGYYIPNGATVISNIWAISRDETRYPDPEMFRPERFLNSDGTLNDDNPSDYVFGFGRRICPGRFSADASVWSSIATMLATLDFNAAKDANGNDIEFVAKFASGITYQPLPFPCNLTPRAHVTRDAIQHSFATR